MKRFFLLLFCSGVLILSGCAKNVDLGPGFQHFSKRFLEALRWQDFRGAALFLQEEHRKALGELFQEHQGNLHIVEADYLFSQLNKKNGTAANELQLKYYLLPSTQIKEWRWKIDWVLLPVDTKQTGTWQVQGAPPAFP